jgi:hypothetical protein
VRIELTDYTARTSRPPAILRSDVRIGAPASIPTSPVRIDRSLAARSRVVP